MAFSTPTLNLFARVDRGSLFQGGGSGKAEFSSRMLVTREGKQERLRHGLWSTPPPKSGHKVLVGVLGKERLIREKPTQGCRASGSWYESVF